MPWLLWLSVAGIIYGALVALAQSDIKRLIAYSSVSHLGFCMLGLFALNRLGVQGGVLQMINHGLSTGGLFAVVGMIYERYHTRQIADFGGLARRTAACWPSSCCCSRLSSIGLPGLNGFVGEFLILLGMFQRGWADAPDVVRVWPIRSSPCWPCSASCWGPGTCCGWCSGCSSARSKEADHCDTLHHADVATCHCARSLALAPLVVFIFWIGLCTRVFPRADAADARAVDSPSRAGVRSTAARHRRTAAAIGRPNRLRTCRDRIDRRTDACRVRPSTCCCRRSCWCCWPRSIYLGGAFLPARRGWSWLAGRLDPAGRRCPVSAGRRCSRPALDAGAERPAARSICFRTTLRWAILGVGWCSSCLPLALLGARRVVRVHGLAADDRRGADACWPGQRPGAVVRRAGADLDSDVRAAVPGPRHEAVLESGTKYFFLSMLSSALLLYGFSFLYGAAGSTSSGGRFSAHLAAAGPDGGGTTAFAPAWR